MSHFPAESVILNIGAKNSFWRTRGAVIFFPVGEPGQIPSDVSVRLKGHPEQAARFWPRREGSAFG